MIAYTVRVALLGCVLTFASAASPPRGSVAPPIVLSDLGGTEVRTAGLAPRTLVLIFGELGHEGTRRAAADALDVLEQPRLAGAPVTPMLIVAQDSPLAELKHEAAKGRYPPVVLIDGAREAFGAYRIVAIPTVVVVDGKGMVVYATPGFQPRFKELLAEGVLVALGRETPARFEELLLSEEQGTSPQALRAARLARLGTELTRHGMYELAQARFAEAIALVPSHVEARLGLGALLLKQERAADAEPLFRAVLAVNPQSAEAALGLAEVRLTLAPDRVSETEAAVRGVLGTSPRNPRAHYLIARIHELNGECAAAAAAYRKAAELALER